MNDWKFGLMQILLVIAISVVVMFSVGGCCKCEDAPEAAAAEEAEAPEEEASEENADESDKEATEAEEGVKGDEDASK